MTRILAWSLLIGGTAFGCGGAEFGTAPEATGGTSGSTGGSTHGNEGTGAGGMSSSPSAGGQFSENPATGGQATGGRGGQGTGGQAQGGITGSGGSEPTEPINECPCSAPTPTCDNGRCVVRGPAMIKAGTFYIDSTEVTVEDYAEFSNSQSDGVSLQPPFCSWNDSFEPSPAPSGGAPDEPVTNVDFCDAAAFCAWADKQLCGKIGGGQLLFQEVSLATESQWFRACGGPDAQLYPYGFSYEAGTCNDNSGAGELAPVASFEECSGFHDGVYDMLGNVAEWIDACDGATGDLDGCLTVGGSYADNSACTGSGLKHRNQRFPTVGFRCCSQ